mgnify:CR=1 FL=1
MKYFYILFNLKLPLSLHNQLEETIKKHFFESKEVFLDQILWYKLIGQHYYFWFKKKN